jgi:hypothetical protein
MLPSFMPKGALVVWRKGLDRGMKVLTGPNHRGQRRVSTEK